MPNHGDQHRTSNAASANPFEEPKKHISVYTAREIATLQSRLNKRLGPEFVSTRPGPGGQKIAYLSAEKAINLANEVFGFNGWSSSIQQIDVDFVEENANTGKVSLGLSVIVRVTLRDGTFHEDIGYGGIENCKGKAMAFEKSKKEATTDALKRTLRNFGNVLGNCIYDRNFVTEVSKVKAGPGAKFDVNDLHRHPDFAPKQDPKIKQENVHNQAIAGHGSNGISHTAFEDSFDIAEFDDVDFDEGDLGRPDEVLLPIEPDKDQRRIKPEPRHMDTPSKPPLPQHTAMTGNRSAQSPSKNSKDRQVQASTNGSLNSDLPLPLGADQEFSSPEGFSSHFALEQPLLGQQAIPGQPQSRPPVPMTGTAGFYSAKAAQSIDPNHLINNPPNAPRFNPHAESPSIRKTAGIDHNKSVPVKRDSLGIEINKSAKDFQDPKVDASRRIGMPAQALAAGRAGTHSSAYRPPTRHNNPIVHNTGGTHPVAASGGDRAVNAVKRPPLADVSNGQHNTTTVAVDGIDAKRQRTGEFEPRQDDRLVPG